MEISGTIYGNSFMANEAHIRRRVGLRFIFWTNIENIRAHRDCSGQLHTIFLNSLLNTLIFVFVLANGVFKFLNQVTDVQLSYDFSLLIFDQYVWPIYWKDNCWIAILLPFKNSAGQKPLLSVNRTCVDFSGFMLVFDPFSQKIYFVGNIYVINRWN